MSKTKELEKYLHLAAEILFPLVLLIFPLLKINQGVDLTDTPYSLGNYRFFEGTRGVWVLATFLSNVAGYVLTKLPMGGTMLGMKLYTSLLISLMALASYRFFKTKMPPFLAFAGEMAAIGFCWCPFGDWRETVRHVCFWQASVWDLMSPCAFPIFWRRC